ncbi:suppressor of fused domain protein [Micromonospora sp. NPDC052213]|uniref:suppressor of fused domain protein n=1 Tax=Micromonospora sp. NPDC052213 TaxID=3155812 RepID=UPI0034299890
MAAPPILRDIFNAYREQRGEEDDGVLFEDEQAPISRLDVLVYRPTGAADMTSFATIGMAAKEMPAAPGSGRGGRAELHLGRRGPLTRPEEHAIAVRLANLAIHPFITGMQLSWGHMIGFREDFPTFPGCRSVFLAGPLSAEGQDYVHTSAGAVRVINVVPITDAERERGRALTPVDFAHSLLEHADIFAERPQ